MPNKLDGTGLWSVNRSRHRLKYEVDMSFAHRSAVFFRSPVCGRYPELLRKRRAVRILQAVLPFLVLSCVMHPLPGIASTNDLDHVLTGTHQRIEALDYRATGRLVRVEGNGQRTTYKFTIKGHWFPDGLRLLCEITEPAVARTRLLLHMTLNGRVTIDVIPPGSKVVVPLPFERWNEGLMGTDFSYEDLVEGQFFWKTQQLFAPAKFGARDCFVLKSVPGLQDRSYYETVTSWIDRSILFPVHVSKVLRGTGQQKEFIYYGLRQTSGVWSASQVEAQIQGRPGSSLFIVDGGSGKAKLARKDFDLSQPNADGPK